MSGIQATAYSYVNEFHSSDTRRRAVAVASTFLPAVMAMAPVIAWIIIPMDISYPIFGLNFAPWRMYLLCCSTMHVLTFMAITWLPESPKFLLSMNKSEEALAVLRKMYSINTSKSETVSLYFQYSQSLT